VLPTAADRVAHAPVATPAASSHPTAWDETPEDSTIYSAAAAPRDGGGGRVVALGQGHACACPVLFETADAGRTWHAAPGPSLGNRLWGMTVALPPAYPDDPRIFISTPPLGGEADMVGDRFGGDFRLLPLSGYITLPPSFETDGILLVAQAAAVVQLRLDPAVAPPLVFEPPLTGTPTVAAPLQGEDVAYVAQTPATNTVAPRPGAVLYRCAATTCRPVSSPPMASVQFIGVSTRFATDHALALAWNHRVLLSRDSGQTFTALPDPGAVVTAVNVTSDASGPVVWATLVRDGSIDDTAIARWDPSSGWTMVIPMAARLLWSGFAHPMVLDATHVVLQTAAGILCTADSGHTWAARCP
jgi:hypothetical protein